MTGYQTESAERQAALRRKVDAANGPEASTPEHPLLTLQSQIGNAQVARLLAQREVEEDEIAAKHDLTLQRAADDEDEVAAKHDLSLQREGDEDELAAKHDLSLQRAADDEDEVAAKHDLSLQRAADEDGEHVGIAGGPVGPDTAQRIASARGGGSALDSSAQTSMEAGFGTSFRDVRVHHDAESDMLNRRLTSHAFTSGNDIFLRGDASPSDNHLIAHELTHVVQQRSMSGSGGMSVGAADDPHEHHADATADAVLSSGPAPAAQRQADEDEVAAKHDLSLQRAAEEEEEIAADHDLSLQRESEEDESPS